MILSSFFNSTTIDLELQTVFYMDGLSDLPVLLSFKSFQIQQNLFWIGFLHWFLTLNNVTIKFYSNAAPVHIYYDSFSHSVNWVVFSLTRFSFNRMTQFRNQPAAVALFALQCKKPQHTEISICIKL